MRGRRVACGSSIDMTGTGRHGDRRQGACMYVYVRGCVSADARHGGGRTMHIANVQGSKAVLVLGLGRAARMMIFAGYIHFLSIPFQVLFSIQTYST